MNDYQSLTHDDVNTAFSTDQVLDATDDQLLGYLRVLCVTQIHSEENRLLANNRAITINAILLRAMLIVLFSRHMYQVANSLA